MTCLHGKPLAVRIILAPTVSVLSLKLLWLQIMSNVGAHLEELNLGGSIMSQLTDEGLKAVPKYCTSLKVTCVTFLIYVDVDVDLNYSIITQCTFLIDICGHLQDLARRNL